MLNLLAYALGAPDGLASATAWLPRGVVGEVALAYPGRGEIFCEMLRSLNLRTGSRWSVRRRGRSDAECRLGLSEPSGDLDYGIG